MRQQHTDHVIVTTDEGLKTRFIMGLGPTFTYIQQKTDDEQPARWKTTNMEILMKSATAYCDEILTVREHNQRFRQARTTPSLNTPTSNPKPKPYRNTPNPPPRNDPPNQPDQATKERREKDQAHQNRIKRSIIGGNFKPELFTREVREGCCIYHNTHKHQHQTCNELNNLLMQHPNQRHYKLPSQMQNFMSWARTSETGRQRDTPTARNTQANMTSPDLQVDDTHIQDTQEATDSLQTMLDEATVDSNLVNENVNHYIPVCNKVCITSPPMKPSTPTKVHSFIVDSGAYPHMCNDLTLFDSISK